MKLARGDLSDGGPKATKIPPPQHCKQETRGDQTKLPEKYNFHAILKKKSIFLELYSNKDTPVWTARVIHITFFFFIR